VKPILFEMFHCTWRTIGQYELWKYSGVKQMRVLPCGQSPTTMNGGLEEDLSVWLVQL